MGSARLLLSLPLVLCTVGCALAQIGHFEEAGHHSRLGGFLIDDITPTRTVEWGIEHRRFEIVVAHDTAILLDNVTGSTWRLTVSLQRTGAGAFFWEPIPKTDPSAIVPRHADHKEEKEPPALPDGEPLAPPFQESFDPPFDPFQKE